MRAFRSRTWGQTTAARADSVIYADSPTRIAFLRKVYTLFSGAMVLWMGTALLVTFNEGLLQIALRLMSGGILGLILLMGALFLLLRLTANAGTGISLLGLGLFGILEGFLTAPLIYIALCQGNEVAMAALQQGVLVPEQLSLGTGIVTQAFALTCAVFGGLSFYALTTKRDFLWMRGALYMGFFVLIAIALLSAFGIGGGIVGGWGYPLAFVILMGGFVLYDTQNIMKRYPPNMAAAAAGTLLLDFVLMFQYMLMLFMRRN